MLRATPPSARRPRAPRRWTAAVLASAIVIGLAGSPATGQDVEDEPPKTGAELEAAEEALAATLELAPESPPSPDDPFVDAVAADERVAETALARLEATSRSNDAAERARLAAQELQAATLREIEALDQRRAADAELEVERERLSDLTVRAYVTGNTDDLEQYRALVDGDTSDAAAGRTIMFDQVLARQQEVTEAAAEAVTAAKAKVRDVRKVKKAASDEAARRMTEAATAAQARVDAERDHLEALGEQEDADRRLRTAGNAPIVPVPLEVPIIGLPRLSAEDLAGWFEQSPYRPRVATPIEDYARWFIEEGRAEGIRGDIAFAQAVLETGGFANTDSVVGNNFSGIGHYDNVPLGFVFASPKAGVRAQIQLLKGYAVRDPDYANPLVDKRLRGPKGCCQTWGDLTTVWATDPTYGPKVMLLYTSLVDYALDRRARGEGFDDPVPMPGQ
ncbi:MAG: glucosaminidase domain-containing protein [Acidimicrobiales bacterium]